MADGAGKLDRLARLKSLRSGMKAKPASSKDDVEALDFDTLFDEGEDAKAVMPKPATPESAERKPVAPDPDTTRREQAIETAPETASEDDDSDPESLSAYFEALGIVPDRKPVAKAAQAAPQTPPPAAPQPEPKPKAEPVTKGRDVDARDRWADPVREDDTFLSSFAGDAASVNEDENLQSLDSIIDSFEDEEPVPPKAESGQKSESAPEPEPAPEPELAEDKTPPEPEPETSVEVPPDVAAEGDEDDHIEGPVDDDVPEFGNEIDIEAFEREIALAEETRAAKSHEPEQVETDETSPVAETDSAPDAGDRPLTITFDENRAATLAQVSKQMGCSIDDVVVTAVDWYLDALFGEDEHEAGAGTGE